MRLLPLIRPPIGTPSHPLTPRERNHKLACAAFCLLCSAVAYTGVYVSTLPPIPGHGTYAHSHSPRYLLSRTAFLNTAACINRQKLRETASNEDGFAVTGNLCDDEIRVATVASPRK